MWMACYRLIDKIYLIHEHIRYFRYVNYHAAIANGLQEARPELSQQGGTDG